MTESQELFLQLIEHALNDKHTEFEKLLYFDSYLGARITYRATKKVIDILDESADDLFNKYCKAIRKQQADVNMLIAYKQIQQAILYYKEEQKIIKDMLEDYEDWLREGHFFKAAFCGEMRDIWNFH
jgi:hypothetical protein